MLVKIRKDGKFDTGRKQVVDSDVLQKLHQAFSLGCSDEEASSFAEIAVSIAANASDTFLSATATTASATAVAGCC